MAEREHRALILALGIFVFAMEAIDWALKLAVLAVVIGLIA